MMAFFAWDLITACSPALAYVGRYREHPDFACAPLETRDPRMDNTSHPTKGPSTATSQGKALQGVFLKKALSKGALKGAFKRRFERRFQKAL